VHQTLPTLITTPLSSFNSVPFLFVTQQTPTLSFLATSHTIICLALH
jgi:hypothetical protein